MILLEIGLERSVVVIMCLVTESCTSTTHQVIVVFGNALLTTPNAITDEGNTTQKNGTTNSTNDTTDDLLVVITKSTTGPASAVLWKRKFSTEKMARGNMVSGGRETGTNACLSVDDGGVLGDEDVDGGRDERG